MKKKLLLTLTVLGAFAFVGCSKKTTKNTTSGNTTVVTTKVNPSSTKANSTTKSGEPTSSVEYEQGNTIKHEIVKDSRGNILSLKSAYKGEEDSEYKYYVKIESTYNSYNLVTETRYYTFDSLENDWVITFKNTYAYNAENKVAVQFENNIKSNTQTRLTYEYANGKRIAYEYAKFNGEEYVNTTRYSTVYEGDNPKTDLTQKWDTTTNSWVNYRKEVKTFENNLEVSFIEYDWNGEYWVNNAKGEIEYYTGTNQEKYYTYYMWNSSSNAFVPYSKYYYDYDENGRRNIQIDYDYKDGEWKEASKYESTYPYVDNASYTSIYYSYDSETGDWKKTSKSIAIVDKYDNWAKSTSYKWDSTINDWVEVDYM